MGWGLIENNFTIGGDFMLEFIENYNDLIENVIMFNDCIKNSDLLKSRLRRFRHWYYIEELDKFAPSKFIGYKGNSSGSYESGTNPGTGYMNGMDTQRVIRSLFNDVLHEGQEIHREFLIKFLNGFGATPNANVHIHII